VQQPTDADWAGGSWDEHPVDFGRVGCGRPSANQSSQWCVRPGIPESQWCDWRVANTSITRIDEHIARSKDTDRKPLFLAVGFRDNHLPWASPPEWYAKFDPSKVNATNHGASPPFTGPRAVPKMAWQYPAWVGPEYNLSDSKHLDRPVVQEALRSYMANIAFTDAQFGKIMAKIEDVGYTNQSIVLITGDHGQNVGEHNTWTKMTAWEHSLRVPLIISVPWLPQSHGQFHTGMSEMVDFYRTLSDLAGIDPASVDKGVEGNSLAPLVANASSPGMKLHAFSQTQRILISHLKADSKVDRTYARLPPSADNFYDPSCFSYNSDIEWMGYSVRTTEWRFTEWLQWNGDALCPRAPNTTSGNGHVELYNHADDVLPLDLDVAEFNNVAGSNPSVVVEMRAVLLDNYVRYCQ
jgi:iduronate 2-sulfatase